jgi:hypothetical protein
MSLDGFSHGDLLLVSLLGEELTLETMETLGFGGDFLDGSGFLLPSFLIMIEPFSISLLVKLHIIILRHFISK